MAKFEAQFLITERFIVEIEAENDEEMREKVRAMSRYEVWEQGRSDGDFEVELVDWSPVDE